ncbi:uncharacterized protein LOC110388737 [Numida meleagris]|uniref:uncharacterized protein LOC110388737 n=1 Tax=Numida meleagris TaxID=8996 RepID=UPI000B3E18F2|nr:uncharacterized protein LOC110388737 [Numida meleagris]
MPALGVSSGEQHGADLRSDLLWLCVEKEAAELQPAWVTPLGSFNLGRALSSFPLGSVLLSFPPGGVELCDLLPAPSRAPLPPQHRSSPWLGQHCCATSAWRQPQSLCSRQGTLHTACWGHSLEPCCLGGGGRRAVSPHGWQQVGSALGLFPLPASGSAWSCWGISCSSPLPWEQHVKKRGRVYSSTLRSALFSHSEQEQTIPGANPQPEAAFCGEPKMGARRAKLLAGCTPSLVRSPLFTVHAGEPGRAGGSGRACQGILQTVPCDGRGLGAGGALSLAQQRGVQPPWASEKQSPALPTAARSCSQQSSAHAGGVWAVVARPEQGPELSLQRGRSSFGICHLSRSTRGTLTTAHASRG